MLLLLAGMALVAVGAAVQAAIGAGLSVVCGSFLLLWLGTATGVPVLLQLNFLVSVVATLLGGTRLRWGDVALVSGAILLGCAVAAFLPPPPDAALRGMTAAVLILAALPRARAAGSPPGRLGAGAGIVGAGIATGVLTLWTATPGPVAPVALARGGRSGDDIGRAMQPISVLGYGVALSVTGLPNSDVLEPAALAGLIAAALLGAGCGVALRPRIDPPSAVRSIRMIAVLAAAALLLSLCL